MGVLDELIVLLKLIEALRMMEREEREKGLFKRLKRALKKRWWGK